MRGTKPKLQPYLFMSSAFECPASEMPNRLPQVGLTEATHWQNSNYNKEMVKALQSKSRVAEGEKD